MSITHGGHAAPPNILSRAQRDALSRLCAATYRRGGSGWQAPGQPAISQSTGLSLCATGHATLKYGSGRPQLRPTNIGREVVGFVRARRERKERGE